LPRPERKVREIIAAVSGRLLFSTGRFADSLSLDCSQIFRLSGQLGDSRGALMNQLVSIYLPTHNRHDYLARAVRSVLEQTYANIELIVVNDGSRDQTVELLNRLQQQDSRLVPIHIQESVGPSAARNIAIKLARGTFVTGLDDDDQFVSNRIASFIERWNTLSASAPFSCLFAKSVFVASGNEWIPEDRKDHVHFEDLFGHNYIGNQVFTTKEYLIEAGLFDENLDAWEDLDLFMRLVQKFGAARLLNLATYICDVSHDRDRISRNERRIRRSFDLILRKYPDLENYLKQRLFLQMFSDYHGIRPAISDFRRFFGWGFRVDASLELVKPLVKASLKSFVGK
jgi:glycosyltransferase involved in cell wall biosynthesis